MTGGAVYTATMTDRRGRVLATRQAPTREAAAIALAAEYPGWEGEIRTERGQGFDMRWHRMVEIAAWSAKAAARANIAAGGVA